MAKKLPMLEEFEQTKKIHANVAAIAAAVMEINPLQSLKLRSTNSKT